MSKKNILTNIVKATGKKGATKTKAVKTTKLDDYRKRGQAILDRGIDGGYEDYMRKILKTLDVNELVKSEKGLEQLKRKMKVVREREGVEKANREYEKKVQVEKAYRITIEQMNEVRNSCGNKTLHNIEQMDELSDLPHFKEYEDLDIADIKRAISDMKMKRLITYVKEITAKQKSKFADTYFMELMNDGDLRVKVEELMDSFDGNLSDFNDFVEHVTSDKFKKNFKSDQERDAYEYKREIVRRLSEAIDFRNRSLKGDKKIKNIKM